MEKIDKVAQMYREIANDMKNPLFREVFNMSKEFPNDADLGKAIRSLVLRIEEFNRAEVEKQTADQLKKIINK